MTWLTHDRYGRKLKEQSMPPQLKLPPGYKRGDRTRAENKMDKLKYDPIEQLVGASTKLNKEIRRLKKLQETSPEEYKISDHIAAINGVVSIGDKLMRYKYARVPETTEVAVTEKPKIIIDLSGDEYDDTDQTTPESGEGI